MTIAFLVALALSLATHLHLCSRQIRHVLAHRDSVPEPFRASVPLDAHRKAADYTVAKTRLSRLSAIYGTALLLAWTLGGGIDALEGLLDGVPFLLAAVAIDALLGLPFGIDSVFGIEKRFGFNRMTPKLFLADLLKSALVGGALAAALAWASLFLMHQSPDFWWAAVWAIGMAAGLFLPHFILPLFWKFTPMPEGEVTGRIRALFERTKFPAKGVFVMDGSRRTAHSNGFFTGFGRQKKVVLFDTLRSQLSPDEIEAVLAHEIGHYKRKHLLEGAILGGAASLAGLGLGAWLLERGWFLRGLGVSEATPWAGLLLLLKTARLWGFPFGPLAAAWSRRREFEADAFAAEAAGREPMTRALVAIYRENASTLTPDPLWVRFYASHPPAPDRIARLSGGGSA
jgi:STE24 endopeptidase